MRPFVPCPVAWFVVVVAPLAACEVDVARDDARRGDGWVIEGDPPPPDDAPPDDAPPDDAPPDDDASPDDDPPGALPVDDPAWPATPAALRATVLAKLDEANAPGGAACVVKDGAVAWCDGFGLAHVEDARAATAHTPFLLASISKVVTGVLAMQHESAGAFALDDDVGDALPFAVAHPTGAALTWRGLLTHTGGVRDDWDQMLGWYAYPADVDDFVDAPYSLGHVVRGYFEDGGAHHGAANFGARDVYAYANMGIALVGYAVEVIAGAPFAAHVDAAVFAPLGMTRSSFDWLALQDDDVAMPYARVGGAWSPYGYYAFSDTPDGGMRASARDLAVFLAALTRDDGTLAPPGTVARMTQPDANAPTQGLVLYSFDWRDDAWWGHGGDDEGTATDMFFRPSDGTGYVLLRNGDRGDDPQAGWDIEEALVDFAETL